MATYNGRKWIEEQVNSVLSQNTVDISILIRDDGSQDGTLEFLQKHYGAMRNIEIRFNKAPSGSAGKNFNKLYVECDLAEFDYVALSDQDDIWHPDKVQNGIFELEANNACGYSCAVEAFWPNGKLKIIQQSSRVSKYDYLYEGCGQGCTYLIRVDVFKRIAEFCKSYPRLTQSLHYHDWLIYLLVKIWGYTWIYDKNPYVKYRQHNSNEIGARMGVVSIYARLKLIKNGWFREQIHAAIMIAKKANPLALPETFSVINKKFMPLSRLLHCYRIYRFGRRRMSDRIILTFFALLGFI